MIKLPFVLAFTALTALSWGVYGILLHRGTDLLGHSSLRAFVGVGIAYFLIAVLIPAIWLGSKKEKGFWSITGTILSLFAGTVGALGALGVILAVAFKGSPVYVMPIVFGGAPVVNTLVTSWINKSFSQIKPMFVVGLVLVALGAVGVLINKPGPSKAPAVAQAADGSKETAPDPAATGDASDAAAVASPETATSQANTQHASGSHATTSNDPINPLAIGASILLAVVCWGAYGPVLHIGQTKMGGSRLRPFCCVGIAYFFIAVAVPVLILMTSSDGLQLTMRDAAPGMLWSILAGTAGAVGALGIILAFNYGGKPVFVMPLVFGFAPVINTLTSMVVGGTLGLISPYFVAALLLGISGAVTVLVFAPKAKPHGAPAAGGHGTAPALETKPAT
ncbi:hypothetical protein SH467x_002178 [Pirellulaceae bacterium SH467]|jgi:hypothetical protein